MSVSTDLYFDEYDIVKEQLITNNGDITLDSDNTVVPNTSVGIARFVIAGKGYCILIPKTTGISFGIQRLYIDGLGNVRLEKTCIPNTSLVKAAVASINEFINTTISNSVTGVKGNYIGNVGYITDVEIVPTT